MQEKTQEEIMEEIQKLDEEFTRFNKTTSIDIMNLIVEEEYPMAVAVGGLTALIDSIIKVYDMEDIRPNCLEILENGFEEIN